MPRPQATTLTKLNLTRRNTVVDRSTRVSTPLRFGKTRMNEALESATSLPDPTAMETSAAARAYAPSFVKSGTEYFDTYWGIVDAISNHGDHATIIQSSPKQPSQIRSLRLRSILLKPPNFVCLSIVKISWQARTKYCEILSPFHEVTLLLSHYIRVCRSASPRPLQSFHCHQ